MPLDINNLGGVCSKMDTPLKMFILAGVVIIIGMIIYKLYVYQSKRINSIEGFATDGGTITDLLTKMKSFNAHNVRDPNSSNQEVTIYPWTTKLHNLQSENQVRPIGLYKPTLNINGQPHFKLGDMVSQHEDYSPPDKSEAVLLINKVASDVKPPTDYDLIVKFGNADVPSYYRDFESRMSPNTNFSSVTTQINTCLNTLNDLSNIVTQNSSNITNGIIGTLENLLEINFYKGYQNYDDKGNPTTFTWYGNIDYLIYQINNYTPDSVTGGVLNSQFDLDWIVKSLPLGVICDFRGVNHNNNSNRETLLTLGGEGDFWELSNKANQSKLLSTLGLQPDMSWTITYIPITYNLFNFIDVNDLQNYLTNLCNSILIILGTPGINNLNTYLNLGNTNDVKSILNALPSAQSSTDIVRQIQPYANQTTLLGTVINYICNYPTTLNYPVVGGFTLWMSRKQQLNNDTVAKTYNDKLTWIDQIAIKRFNPTMFNDKRFYTLDLSPSNSNANTVKSTFTNLSIILAFQNDLNAGKLDYFPLQIYAPIAPAGYTALGHVFGNKDGDLDKIKQMNNVACVPSQCVKEVRDWALTDKIFEYNQGGKYWALYRNPYIGTFIAVNQNRLPDGKVSKVVACVAKCTAVDELKKADECARTYQKLNSKIENKLTSSPNLVASTEESIYLDQIKQQNDNILALQKRAQRMQIDIDKADIITTEMNKAKLQDYVDTQKRNIELVTDRLERDQNRIQTNINIPTSVLNQLISIIQNLPNIPDGKKQELINKITDNAKAANSGLMTYGEYNANLNNILKSCPQYDFTGLVKKKTVGDVCYGCGTPS